MTHRPNLLILMVDQLTGTLFPDGPADFLHVPNLRRLAHHALRFQNCYTASPLCAPARASILSGLLPSRTRVYDNGAEFASDIPTYAHHLRRAGYYTVLSGKMDFVGPDQLHGFEDRLTADIRPADFGLTPDIRKDADRPHTLASVTEAGVADITDQLEYDDEVAFHAVQKLYDLSRGADPRPWCMTVSFAHPQDPYVARRKYWALYENAPELASPVPIAYADQDPHSRRNLDTCPSRGPAPGEAQIRRARQAYFANISYIDDKIGEIFRVLEATRQEATVIFLSDHGDMLGERSLWSRMTLFEAAARVPLMIAAPDLAPGLVTTPVSTLDVAPTIATLAGLARPETAPTTDGVDLTRLAHGGARPMVAMEYVAEGTIAPMIALREGAWKYIGCPADPDQLFDLTADPEERDNLASDPRAAPILDYFRKAAQARWDLARLDAEVRESQARRRVVYDALHNGARFPWNHHALRAASERFLRNHMTQTLLEDAHRPRRTA